MLGDSVRALISERIQLLDKRLAFDPLTGGDAPRELADPERSQEALRRGAGRGDKQLRLVALRLERVQGRQPLGHDSKRRRSAVVGQAVPAGEGQHLDFRREQGNRIGERAQRRFVGGNHGGSAARARSVSRAREIGGKPWQEARRNAGKRQWLLSAENALQRLGHRAIRT